MSSSNLIESFVNVHSVQPVLKQSHQVEARLQKLNSLLDKCLPMTDVSSMQEWFCLIGDIYCQRLASTIAYRQTSATIFKEELTVFLTGIQHFIFKDNVAEFSAWLSNFNDFPISTQVENPNADLMTAMAANLKIENPTLENLESNFYPQLALPPASQDVVVIPNQANATEKQLVSNLQELKSDPVMRSFLTDLVGLGSEIKSEELKEMIQRCQGNDLEIVTNNFELFTDQPRIFQPGQILMKSYKCPSQSPYWRVEFEVKVPTEIDTVADVHRFQVNGPIDDQALQGITHDVTSMVEEIVTSDMPSHAEESQLIMSRPPSPGPLIEMVDEKSISQGASNIVKELTAGLPLTEAESQALAQVLEEEAAKFQNNTAS